MKNHIRSKTRDEILPAFWLTYRMIRSLCPQQLLVHTRYAENEISLVRKLSYTPLCPKFQNVVCSDAPQQFTYAQFDFDMETCGPTLQTSQQPIPSLRLYQTLFTPKTGSINDPLFH